MLPQSLQLTSLNVHQLGIVDLGYIVNETWDNELTMYANEVIQ